jgi:hypothetical protein
MTLAAAQQHYDSMLPPDQDDIECTYTGEIWVKGILFEYEDGILQHVTVPSELWPLTEMQCRAYQMIADGEACGQ